jgi:peptidoglycan/xylan/chitin deacetylase (PgdA/CDA1 family)
MKIISPPKIITGLYHSLEWKMPLDVSQKVYLTFDDGPTPAVTDYVLKELNKAGAKATFFCIGKNVENHPKLFSEIIAEGHQVGNHTQHHVNGWRTSTEKYLEEIKRCSEAINSRAYEHRGKALFRPPYGKITRSQIKAIKADYRIVMWSILAYDWLPERRNGQCLNNVISHLRKDAIIVMHDSVKAYENIRKTLPELLHKINDKGYQFGLI